MSSPNLLEEFSTAIADSVERASRAVVAIDARRHMLAAGVHWREGVIVTANHAVRREDGINVLLPDGSSVSASLAGRDPSTDLAILKIASSGVALPVTGEPASIKAGQIVLVVGRVEAGPRAGMGVVGVAGGHWRTWRGGEVDRLIRLGFELHPTLSGGLVTDLQGRALGITTSGLSRTFGVAIPIATVNRVVDLLLQKGHVPKGYLGVGVWPVPVSSGVQEKLSLTQAAGLMVQHVEPDGPAEKAGVLMGDVILSVDAKPLGSIQDLNSRLSTEAVGQTSKVVVIRAGALSELSVRIGERPR